MKRNKLVMVHFVIIFYVILITILSFVIPSNNLSTLEPFLYLVLIIYLFFKTDNKHGRFSNLVENIKTMFIITLFYIIIYYSSGLITGYSKSPYSHEFLSILKNIWQVIFVIVGIEYSRSVIINENKSDFLNFIFTVLFIFLEIKFPHMLSNFETKEVTFKYLFSNLIPVIFSSILYSYLTLKGSYKLVLTNRIPFELSLLLTPIIPYHDWFVKGVIGLLYSLVIYILMNFFINYRKERTNKNRKHINPIIYIPILTVILFFILFMIGVFKYEPIAIITNSMHPIFNRGDVVVYEKPSKSNLKKIELYTIIIYNKEGQAIVHRVVDKYYKNNKLFFITKGDANNSNDKDPVKADQVIGVYKLSIKYIGGPSVWLNDIFKQEKAKVEIK